MKRARKGAPARLSWGGGDNLSSKLETRQRPRKNNDMWTDQYAPTEVSELCVAPKKVKQVQEWLEDGAGGMMILVGSPGIDNSTMAKLVCNKVHEWVEEPACVSPTQFFSSFLHQSMYLNPATSDSPHHDLACPQFAISGGKSHITSHHITSHHITPHLLPSFIGLEPVFALNPALSFDPSFALRPGFNFEVAIGFDPTFALGSTFALE